MAQFELSIGSNDGTHYTDLVQATQSLRLSSGGSNPVYIIPTLGNDLSGIVVYEGRAAIPMSDTTEMLTASPDTIATKGYVDYKNNSETLDSVSQRGSVTTRILTATNFITQGSTPGEGGQGGGVNQEWVNDNFYNKVYIDDTYYTITESDIRYYTKEQADEIFLTEEVDTLQSVAARGNVTVLDLEAKNFITTGSNPGEGGDGGATQQWVNDNFYNKNYINALTTTDIDEGTNLYYTEARFDARFATKTTNDLTEGSNNLYYTDARSRLAVSSNDIDLLYNNTTGVFGLSDNVARKDINNQFETDQDVDGEVTADNFVTTGSSTGSNVGEVSQQWVDDNFLRLDETAADSLLLNGQDPTYYLNWANILNIPTTILYTGDNNSRLINDSGYYNASNFIAGTDYQAPITRSDLNAFPIAFTDVENTFLENITFDKNVVIEGDLHIKGTTTQIDTQIVTADNVIDMNAGETGSGVTAGHSGLYINRGTSESFWLGFDEVRDKMTVGKIASLTAPEIASTRIVASRSDDSDWVNRFIPMWDSTTKGFIKSEVEVASDDSVIATNFITTSSQAGQAGGVGDATQIWVTDNFLGITATAVDSDMLGGQLPAYYLNWNNFTNVPDGYLSSDFDNDFATKTTDDLAEGGNLYFTQSRTRESFSEDITGMNYNSSTGVLGLDSDRIIITNTQFDAKYDATNFKPGEDYQAPITEADNIAYTDVNNEFSVGQTVAGTVQATKFKLPASSEFRNRRRLGHR